MKKIFIRIGVLTAVFLLGIVAFSHVMNIENTDQTSEVEEPTLPVVYIRDGDQISNAMFGYTQEMQANYMRDTLTLLPSDYALEAAIEAFGANVKKVSYEVRSADAGRLVESTEDVYLTEKDGYLNAKLPIKKLLEEEEEYILRIILETDEHTSISYYTRITDKGADYDLSEELAFCLDFSEKTFDPEQAAELSTYLEPNSQGDNSSFAHVDIHSNYRMVTYDGLNAQRVTAPVPSLVEARSTSASYRLEYLISAEDDEGTLTYYEVSEYFRVRAGDDRMYLLDYERTMDQIFMQAGTEYSQNAIYLGILSEKAEMQASEDGQIAAFVQQGTLWCYNNTNGQITRVYGQADDVTDVRKRRCDYGIQIADVDETGSLDFIVYGYINRGNHEGSVGILACRYDATSNTVEEKVFLPYDKSFAQMRLDIGKLAYTNRDQQLYCMLEGAVFCIDLNARTCETIAEGLDEDCYVISEDGQMFAWLAEKDAANSQTLKVLNLDTGYSYLINAGDGECLRAVGFMGHDLVYGTVDTAMLRTDKTGNLIFPMKRLQIVDENGETVRDYEQAGVYVLDAVLEEEMIVLTRAVYNEETNTFTDAGRDQIISNSEEMTGQTVLESFATDARKTQYRVRFTKELKELEPQVRIPREVLFEGSRKLALPGTQPEDVRFYVYGRGRLDMICQRAGDAIERADELQGVVVNAGGSYIWEKGNRAVKVEVTGITARAATEEETSISVCVELMLNHAGIYENVLELMNAGSTPLQILEEYIPGQVVDLTGCTLDAALYFVNQKVPVFAMKSSTTAALILGYDEFGNLILLDPMTGETGKMGPKDSEAMFEEAGNVFISYVPAS